MAKVFVSRKGLQAGLIPYKIEIDGATHGALRMGGKLEVDLPPGRHTIVVGLDSTATFDNSDGRDTYIECKASKWNNKAIISVNRGMALFSNETPETRVASALNVMLSESKADAVERRGTSNRPKYVAAQKTIKSLGAAAVEPLLTHLVELKGAKDFSPEFDLASDVVELLGEIGDERAVPALVEMLSGTWSTVPFALGKSAAGTRALLAASTSDEASLRGRSMRMWNSRYFPNEVVAALCGGLQDPDVWVRNEAISGVIARDRADPQIVEVLQKVRSVDPDLKARDRADNALNRLGMAPFTAAESVGSSSTTAAKHIASGDASASSGPSIPVSATRGHRRLIVGLLAVALAVLVTVVVVRSGGRSGVGKADGVPLASLPILSSTYPAVFDGRDLACGGEVTIDLSSRRGGFLKMFPDRDHDSDRIEFDMAWVVDGQLQTFTVAGTMDASYNVSVPDGVTGLWIRTDSTACSIRNARLVDSAARTTVPGSVVSDAPVNTTDLQNGSVGKLDRPAEWPPPGSEVASAATGYLKGPGVTIVTVLDQVIVLTTGTPSASTCATAAGVLDATAGPSAFMEIVVQVPDEVLGELVSDLVATTHDALTACIADSADSAEVFAALRANIGYIQLRLTELGTS